MAEELKLAIAPEETLVKLDLGSGKRPKEGFKSVDLNADADYKLDLFKFPWPFKDDSVDEIHCSHFIEHIPARDIEERDLVSSDEQVKQQFIGQDMFLAFFDELYRIMKKDSVGTFIWPALKSERAFMDPTHRRFIPTTTMAYLSDDWRKQNSLDHYRVKCNFSSNIVPTIPTEMTLLHPEAQQRRFNESWNTVFDYHATLKPIK